MITSRKNETSLSVKLIKFSVPRTTIIGNNIWSEWGEWSQCTRSCGACGIQSRVRTCKTAHCRLNCRPPGYVKWNNHVKHINYKNENFSGKVQEFSTCNSEACPVDPRCAKFKFQNRLCADGSTCGR